VSIVHTARPAATARAAAIPDKRRNLIAACLGHVLHDGYTAALYAFLPVWQAQFGFSYAGLALIRALYSGTMGGVQMPGAKLVQNWSPRTALVSCTVIASLGFLLMAMACPL
jgi:FSR family fosmidomycin resistance protein-like MFS transporter